MFPAHAGMDRTRSAGSGRTHRVPRACGDGPLPHGSFVQLDECSPRMRGWTVDAAALRSNQREFPAHAGMACSPRIMRFYGFSFSTWPAFGDITSPNDKAPLLRGFDGPACHVPGVVLGLGKTVGQHHDPVNACNREALCGISAPAGSRGSCTGIFERCATGYRTLAADFST